MELIFFSIRWSFVHKINVTCVLYLILLLRKNWMILASLWQYYISTVSGTAQDTSLCTVPTLIQSQISSIPKLVFSGRICGGFCSCCQWFVEVNFMKFINWCFSGEYHIYVNAVHVYIFSSVITKQCSHPIKYWKTVKNIHIYKISSLGDHIEWWRVYKTV